MRRENRRRKRGNGIDKSVCRHWIAWNGKRPKRERRLARSGMSIRIDYHFAIPISNVVNKHEMKFVCFEIPNLAERRDIAADGQSDARPPLSQRFRISPCFPVLSSGYSNGRGKSRFVLIFLAIVFHPERPTCTDFAGIRSYDLFRRLLGIVSRIGDGTVR